MAEIGRRGAAAFWSKYRVTPAATRGWAIVERATNTIVAFVDNDWRPPRQG